MRLKKGDLVKVVRGKDQGKTGKIDRVFSKVNKILVLGANQYKRHLKARSAKQPSEIATIIKPLPVSNVVFVCPKCQLSTRIGFSYEDNRKIRICKRCKQRV
jgi:large subunit ribosomal protein L24